MRKICGWMKTKRNNPSDFHKLFSHVEQRFLRNGKISSKQVFLLFYLHELSAEDPGPVQFRGF